MARMVPLHMIKTSQGTPKRHSTSTTVSNTTIRVWPEYALSKDLGWDGVSLTELREKSSDNPNSVYVPGTYIEIDGWETNIAPVIHDGEIILKRSKIYTHYTIHNWERAAERVSGEEELATLQKAKRTIAGEETGYDMSEARDIVDLSYIWPKSAIKEKVNKAARRSSAKTVQTATINGIDILPIICNEVSSIPQQKIHEADVIVDVSYDFPNWKQRYEEYASDDVEDGTLIVRADGVLEEQSGCYLLTNSVARIET